MTDETIRMCTEHIHRLGFCQLQYGHKEAHVWPAFAKTYTQTETDALIAGAYLEIADILKKIEFSYDGRSPRQEAIDATLSAMPDAARLALEEREKELRDDVLEEAASHIVTQCTVDRGDSTCCSYCDAAAVAIRALKGTGK